MNKVALFFVNWWKNTIDELRDPALRYFGVALACTHILSLVYLYWRDFHQLFQTDYSICWPFFPTCYALRPWTSQFVNAYFISYGLVALISAALFLKRSVRLAWCLSLLALILKFGLTIQDYRMMGNFHYMPYIVCFLFLFYPFKRQVIPRMIVGFYLGAGLIKFNFEWLSGASLLKTPPVTGWVLVILCAYVIVLEMIISLGLLSSRKNIFIFSMSQILLFHIVSYQQVYFFYPSVMFCLLSIFFLPSLVQRKWVLEIPALNRTAAVPLLLFALAQVFPHLISKDPGLTGEGRMFSLNMMDIHSQCSHSAIHRAGNLNQEIRWSQRGGIRIHCDPVVLLSLAHQHCVQNQGSPSFIDLDLFLSVRRTTGKGQHVLALKDVCSQKPDYKIWKKNPFILEK